MTALLLAAALPAAAVIETTRHLDLRVTVVEAVEDGPIVLDVSLTNRGTKPLTVCRIAGDDCEIIPPPEWPGGCPRRACGFRYGWLPEDQFDPGQTWSGRYAPHVIWTGRFPPGAVPVIVSWPLYASRGLNGADPGLVAVPQRTVFVEVAAATPGVVAAAARRAEADIIALPPAPPTGTFGVTPLDAVADRVLFAPHKPFAPAALKLLDRCPVGSKRFGDDTSHIRAGLVWTVFGADPAGAHKLFVDRLTSKTPPADPAAEFAVWEGARSTVVEFGGPGYWREVVWAYEHNFPPSWHLGRALQWLVELLSAAPRLLPADELRRLGTADDFWVRALTFAAFADKLDPAWKETFLRDVRGRHPGPPAEVVRQLVRDLGDERYAIRDRADRRLRSHGHAVASDLRAALTASPSAEVRQRAEAILAVLDGEPLDRRAALVFSSLYHQPGAGRLLDALAVGPDTDPVVKAARERRGELARP